MDPHFKVALTLWIFFTMAFVACLALFRRQLLKLSKTYQLEGTNKKSKIREVFFQTENLDTAYIVGNFGWRAREYDDVAIIYAQRRKDLENRK